MKHFLKETDFTPQEAAEVFALARDLKQKRGTSATPAVLQYQTWALIFSKSSTRTRVSFEVGVHELGGNPLFLNKGDIQLGRGESVEDTARVLSRFVHGLIVRTYAHSEVERLAASGTIPVINALTDFLHPCQIYTDAFTMAERWASANGDLFASLKGRKIAFLGDTACNMANSWILGANLFGMDISLAGPKGFEPSAEFNTLLAAESKRLGLAGRYQFTHDPCEAVKNADVVYTDVWVSMGKEDEAKERIAQMSPYSVTAKLFAAAKSDALFMHCLPAYVGKEVTQEVLDNPRSIIFDQAENRLHTQKAIMTVLARHARHP
ncbi:ornithine carbamoyltransferase [Geminisphaera colitermitum]|uniref:ornithine carbamoyltransferase n=1 Tax=Geminisphaera colitermitum TaxID=1148786 RepID=UPI000196521E|nr:ornithine carbamoyltransferase [Geminisphaera colitermitum]